MPFSESGYLDVDAVVMCRVRGHETFDPDFMKMPRNWWVRPLDPIVWFLAVMWIPVNLVYLSLQLGAYTWRSRPRYVRVDGNRDVWLGRFDLVFNSAMSVAAGRVKYGDIVDLRSRSRDLEFRAVGERFRITSPEHDWLEVALRHQTAHAPHDVPRPGM